MRIDFVRHGHCTGNAFLRGRSPAELSFLGRKQMLHTLEEISQPDVVICSPAKRCADLTQAYYSDQKALDVEYWDDFQERYFGVWDGLSYEEIQALDAPGFKSYLDQPFDYEISDAETLADFEVRVQQVFKKLLNDATEKQLKHLVVLTHGGVMRVLLKQALGLSDDALFQLEMGFAARMSLECIEVAPEIVLEKPTTQKPSSPYFIKLLELVQSPLTS